MAKQLEFLEKKVAIFLLDLFQNIWKNRGCTTKKKIRKYWQYNLPTIGKIVDEKVLPLGWNSSCHPRLDKLCNWNMYTLSSEMPGSILSCGYGYHIECFIQIDQKCSHCYKYLSDGIKYHCKVFQNTLNMTFNNNIDEDSEDLESQIDSEESNVDEIVFINKDINRKLEEALESFKLCQ